MGKIHFWYLFLHYILIICLIRTEKVPDFENEGDFYMSVDTVVGQKFNGVSFLYE